MDTKQASCAAPTLTYSTVGVRDLKRTVARYVI